MFPTITQEGLTSLKDYANRLAEPGFEQFVNSQSVGQRDELPLMTYRQILSYFEVRQHEHDSRWPLHYEHPISTLSLADIRKRAFADKKEGVLSQIEQYEQVYVDNQYARIQKLEADDLWQSSQQAISSIALEILEHFLRQHGHDLSSQVAEHPDNPLQYARLEEKLRTYRRLTVYDNSRQTDETTRRSIAHEPIKAWERGLGELYKGFGSPEEVARILSLIADYRKEKGY